MLTRKEFATYWNNIDPNKQLGSCSSPLWIPEDDCNVRCEWFVSVKPVNMHTDSYDKTDFWSWCSTNLTGIVLCFASNPDDQEEWWGFEKQQDIVWWMLKWA
jgi:hypothetical protein